MVNPENPAPAANCPHCGEDNRPGVSFCEYCGRLLAERCPRCGFDRLPDGNFCGRCGIPLHPRAYLALGEAGQTGARAAMQPVAAKERQPPTAGGEGKAASRPQPAVGGLQSALDQYLPRELRAKLDAARAGGSMAGERRVVSILFCDVKGSTAAAEQLDPEEWTEIINGAFEFMIKPVYKYEGMVARLMGDAILAFFGAPIAHEDDPQRAVLAGLDIVQNIRVFREQVRRDWGLEIDVRVGINTGMVVVGAVGSDLRMEYTATGDAINLAARMEQTAKPGTVQIAADTYKLVRSLFDVWELGGIEVKGKSEPVQAYRVIGRVRAGERVRGIEGLHADMVGRDRETAILRDTLSGLQQGIGRIVCLVGEAGLGKSRMLREWRAAAHAGDAQPVQFIEASSLSYETAQPYGLVKRLLRRWAGSDFDVPNEELHNKLKPLFVGLDSDRALRAEKALGTLFGFTNEDTSPPLEGETFKRELFSAVSAMLRAHVAAHPSVVILDDVHWADTVSIELLLHLLPLADETALVLVCAFRPNRDAPVWQFKTTADEQYHHRYTEIELSTLSDFDTQELISRLLAIAEIPDILRQRIQERAGGNPLYVEEVVRTLIDNGTVVAVERRTNGDMQRYWQATGDTASMAIPDSLQSLLAARIDRLEEETRSTLQLAAVIGRTFFERVLTAIGEQEALPPPELAQRLGALVRMEMIQEAARVPEVEYRFRNPLTQEVVYETILLKRRREFHRRVGDAMEALFPERLDELAHQLAFHFGQAGEVGRAVEFHSRAGDAAFRLYANAEAIAHYESALRLVQDGAAASSAQLEHLFSRTGRAHELDSQFEAAWDTYVAMEALGRERDDDALRLAALVQQGALRTNVNQLFDLQRGEELVQQALQLARDLGDEVAEARTYWNLLNLHRTGDRTHVSLDAGERAMQLARKHNLRELEAFVANDLPYVYMAAGETAKAEAVAEQARALWRELGNMPMLADSTSSVAIIKVMTGKLGEVIALSDEAYEISASIDNLWGMSYSRYSVGQAYWLRGDPSQAIEMMQTCVRYGEQAGFVVARAWAEPGLALVYGELGQAQSGLRMLQDTTRYVREVFPQYLTWVLVISAYLNVLLGDTTAAQALVDEINSSESAMVEFFMRPYLLITQALLALSARDYDRVAMDVPRAVAWMHEFEIRVYDPHLQVILAQAQLASGAVDAAADTLAAAYEAALDMNTHWYLWQIRSAQAEAAAAQSDAESARKLRTQAREIVAAIAEHTPEEFRATFLARPGVQALG